MTALIQRSETPYIPRIRSARKVFKAKKKLFRTTPRKDSLDYQPLLASKNSTSNSTEILASDSNVEAPVNKSLQADTDVVSPVKKSRKTVHKTNKLVVEDYPARMMMERWRECESEEEEEWEDELAPRCCEWDADRRRRMSLCNGEYFCLFIIIFLSIKPNWLLPFINKEHIYINTT